MPSDKSINYPSRRQCLNLRKKTGPFINSTKALQVWISNRFFAIWQHYESYDLPTMILKNITPAAVYVFHYLVKCRKELCLRLHQQYRNVTISQPIKYKQLKVSVLILIFLIPIVLPAQDVALEKFADSLMGNRSELPASYLLIARDGKPVVRKAYGLASLELNAPARPEHLFTIASVSKQMIAVAMLQLAANGKLKLTDDIRKYLPRFDTHGQVVTIEHLLTHTSGIYSETGATGAKGKTLFDLTVSHGILSDDEFMNYIMQHDLFFTPGTDWGWNGHAYFLAFFIVEKASGMRFNEYMRQHVFGPAGMTNTFTKADGNRLGLSGTKNFVSTFYYPDVDGKWVWRDFRKFTPFHFYERYAVVTCLDDLLKWDIALREGKLLPKPLLEKAWTPYVLRDGRITNYGYGWVLSQINGIKVLSHIGIGTNPICTVHVPERNLYMAYTQFFGTYEQAEVTLKKILSRMLTVPYPKPAKTEAPLKDYTGVYAVHRMGIRTTPQLSDIPVYINVSTSGDTLYIQQTATEKTWVRPAGKDRFFPARSENTWYVFTRDENGEVNAITSTGTFWTFGPDVLNKKINKTWPGPPKSVLVSAQDLKKYTGVYYLPSLDIYRFVETDGVKLYNRTQGNLEELTPIANNKFVRRGIEDITFEFRANSESVMIMTVSGLRAVDFRKISD